MSATALQSPAPAFDACPAWLQQELRSDHAGETGAVAIYQGILAVSRSPEVRAFALEHLATEQRHLEIMDVLVAPGNRSRLTWMWRLAGWVTGALSALFGPRAVFRTIDAVETFVDDHYLAQIEMMRLAGPKYDELRAVLSACRDDELAHRDDARGRAGRDAGPAARVWAWLVDAGSRAAVAAARRI